MSFFAQEILSDSYYCESCHTHTSAIKRFIIGSTPTILLIHLKRFNMYPKRVKLHGNVKFPIKLNMNEYLLRFICNRYSAHKFDNNY